MQEGETALEWINVMVGALLCYKITELYLCAVFKILKFELSSNVASGAEIAPTVMLQRLKSDARG